MKSDRNQEKKEENKDLTLSAKIPVKTQVFPGIRGGSLR